MAEDEAPAEHEVPPVLRDAVAELLYHSQMIEGLLRVYLADLNEVADNTVTPKGFRFKVRDEELKKVPMGKLVAMYANHSDVDWLAKRLHAFVKVRNDNAHQMMLWGFIHRGNPEKIAAAVVTLQKGIAEAKVLVHALTLETVRTFELKTGRTVSPPPVDMSP